MIRFLTTLLLTASLLGAQRRPVPVQGLPVLIDRELLFGNPEIAGAQLSPDGRYLAFLKPSKGVLNIWVKGTGEPFSAARLLTAEPHRPVTSYLWTRDSKFVGYVKDNDGDENFNLYVVDPSGKPAEGAEAPPSRDLTGLKGVTVQLYSAPRNDPDILYIGINGRDKAWHDLYKVSVSTGEKTLLRQNSERVSGWVFDLHGQLRLATRTADNGDSEVLRVDPGGFTRVYFCSVFETCAPVRFDKDSQRLYLLTNKGDDTDLAGLALLDPETGKTEKLESDPLKRVDLSGVAFSEASDELILTAYVDDRTRRYFKDKKYEADFKWLAGKLPGREIGLASHSADDRMLLLAAYSDTEPGETYLFDRGTRTLTLQYKVREKVPREALVPIRAIRYKSSDGLEIPAYLTLPKGLPPRNLPLVVVPHGGPWSRDGWGYNPLAQFLANRGYAVLMPNFRGSTGYGKKFLNAGNGEWGRKMQDDITWGVKYLAAQGTVNANRVGIMGGSYGGYATLAGVAFTPDLYRAGVDIVGPSNLKTLLDAIPPYWEAARKMMYTRMADPATPEGKAWLNERSPLREARKIKAALMVAQGANDPRVNKGEAEQIVVALRDRSFPVEYLLAPDEGHGFARPVNNMALYMAAERFLARHLDGRYQEGGSPEVVKRLAEITVDPKTVALPAKVDAASLAPPRMAAGLKPGTYKYTTRLNMNNQEFKFASTTTIKDEDGAWTAIEVDETPMGTASDKSVLEKGTLAVRKRSLSQGAAVIEIDFTDDKATGVMSQAGQVRNISAPLEGPLFADAAGSMQAIASLPLAAGYTLVYRNFDLQRQTGKLMRLAVTGTETVTVPAGTFDCFTVEIKSAEGGNDRAVLWVAKDTRQAVRMATTMAAASVITELEQ
jgi:dipeptidyl aminopeptidase/acylaminoacyl peptidase